MKKLIAFLAAALFCIGAGVEYIKPKEDTFVLNTFDEDGRPLSYSYWSPNKDVQAAADIWRQQNGVSHAIAQCAIAPTTPKREGGDGWASVEPYWFAITTKEPATYFTTLSYPGTNYKKVQFYAASGGADTTVEFPLNVDVQVSLSDDKEFYICAPSRGTIETSHYDCDGGHRMVFRFALPDATYLMSIEGAKCWYCCKDKDPNKAGSGCTLHEDGTVTYTANTTDSLKGKTMLAGQLLCVGTATTTIKLVKEAS